MDEVGLIVTSVEAGGAIRFEKVGLVADAVFPGREVALLTLDGHLHKASSTCEAGTFKPCRDKNAPASMRCG